MKNETVIAILKDRLERKVVVGNDGNPAMIQLPEERDVKDFLEATLDLCEDTSNMNNEDLKNLQSLQKLIVDTKIFLSASSFGMKNLFREVSASLNETIFYFNM